MANEEPQNQQSQGRNRSAQNTQDSIAVTQYTAELLTDILQQVSQRLQFQPFRDLSEEAQRAVDAYETIKERLRTPQIGNPLPNNQQWNVPELNETAQPREQEDG